MKRVAWAYWVVMLLVGVFVVAAQAGVPISSEVTKTAGPITSTIPVVTNTTVSTIATLVVGTGSVNLGYKITNEDTTNAIRCEYGSTVGVAPVTTPTSTVGFAVLPGATYVELIAPNNRLDCIAAAGSPKISLTVYPK
jgi:hypothetical protein